MEACFHNFMPSVSRNFDLTQNFELVSGNFNFRYLTRNFDLALPVSKPCEGTSFPLVLGSRRSRRKRAQWCLYKSCPPPTSVLFFLHQRLFLCKNLSRVRLPQITPCDSASKSRISAFVKPCFAHP